MVHIIFEEMEDEIENMIFQRLKEKDRRHTEAEQKLKDWFAQKGIELEIMGWDAYYKKKEC